MEREIDQARRALPALLITVVGPYHVQLSRAPTTCRGCGGWARPAIKIGKRHSPGQMFSP
jgi:hypothetical protein